MSQICSSPVFSRIKDEEIELLHKVEENTDWQSKYQAVLNDLEAHELEWTKIEKLPRKTIGRLSDALTGVYC